MILQERLKTIEVVLGSKSPRRKELLSDMDIAFKVEIRETDESYDPNLSPIQIVQHIADAKLAAFPSDEYADKLVICADTIVLDERGAVLGKPKDLKEAKEVIQGLSGKMHWVFTAVSCAYQNQFIRFVEETQVWLNNLSEAEIEYYVQKYQPLDKAGSYGIQEWIGRIGIGKIIGSYENVIGLPTARLQVELKKFFSI